jgi:hypothetical protein
MTKVGDAMSRLLIAAICISVAHATATSAHALPLARRLPR